MSLSWLPVLGDPLCAIAGWLKLPFRPCVFYMAVGKLARYGLLTAVLLWLYPGALLALTRGPGKATAESSSRSRRPKPDTSCPPPLLTKRLPAPGRACIAFGHLQSIASWDQAANMPPKGNEARARQKPNWQR